MDKGMNGLGARGRHKGLQRRLVALLVTALCVTGTSLTGPATAVETAGRLRTSTPQVSVGGKMIFTGKLPTEIRRTIKLQRKTTSGWLLVTKGTTTRRGKFDLTATAPSTAGSYTFRVKAPRKVTTARTYKALKTPSVVVSVSSPPVVAPPPPAPPPPAPAPPPPPLGSRENPFPINTYFTSGPWGFVVSATDTDAWPEMYADDPYNDPPLPGWSFVAVPVSFTYIGTTSGTPYFSYVEFVGSNGVVYDDYEDTTNQVCFAPNDWFYLPELYPGGNATGNVCAIVPSNAVQGGLWRLSGDSISPQRFSRLS